MKSHKYERILDIYKALCEGKVVNKEAYASKHEVDARTIQRDIDDIRSFLSDSAVMEGGAWVDVVYDHRHHGYKAA